MFVLQVLIDLLLYALDTKEFVLSGVCCLVFGHIYMYAHLSCGSVCPHVCVCTRKLCVCPSYCEGLVRFEGRRLAGACESR